MSVLSGDIYRDTEFILVHRKDNTLLNILDYFVSSKMSQKTRPSLNPTSPAVPHTMAEPESGEGFQSIMVILSSLKQLNILPHDILNLKIAIDNLSGDCPDMKFE